MSTEAFSAKPMMTTTPFINDAKVSPTDQVMINPAIYSLIRFQEQMKGQAEEAGFKTEEDVAEWITNSRREESSQCG